MAATPTPSSPMRAIDRLRKAANFEPVVHTIILDDDSEFCFQSKPLTAAERERAQKNAKSSDANAFAMQLLIIKAEDLDGQPLFKPGDIAALKHEVPDDVLQKMILAVLKPNKEESEEVDMKSD